eukprot:scaffold248216_cov17-Tisochrysis_lutea.AAC.2
MCDTAWDTAAMDCVLIMHTYFYVPALRITIARISCAAQKGVTDVHEQKLWMYTEAGGKGSLQRKRGLRNTAPTR